ncbi:MarR family winged helix-turn-helix transcriptional regulator [Amycolatopsis acididurans]
MPIGLRLANTAKTVGRAFDDTLAAAGGSSPVWLVLLTLKTQAMASQREIAAAVGIQGATLTHHLNGMERDGLITRTRDPENRRVHQVRLTGQGEEMFHRLATAAQAHDERLREGFTEDELETLEKLLTRLQANVTAPREGA